MRIALAGDTMLGRGVAEVLAERPPASLVAPEVAELTRSADVAVLDLECCNSDRGAPFPLAGKPYFFRAPPNAVELLTHLGIACVTLANNYALDFGEVALLDTVSHLDRAGIRHVGAGPELAAARTPATLPVDDDTLTVIGFTDPRARRQSVLLGRACDRRMCTPVSRWSRRCLPATVLD